MDEYKATIHQAYMSRHPYADTHIVAGFTPDHPQFGRDRMYSSEVQSMTKNAKLTI